MEPDRAREILKALADGRDPVTGQQFPPDSPYQQAETVRALYIALEAMDRKPRTKNQEPGTARPQAGADWTPEEEQQLRTAFNAHKPIPEIAATHGRTPGAITARLARMGLIADTATNRAGVGDRPIRPISQDRLPSVASAQEGPEGHSVTPAQSRPPEQPRPLTQEELDSLPF